MDRKDGNSKNQNVTTLVTLSSHTLNRSARHDTPPDCDGYLGLLLHYESCTSAMVTLIARFSRAYLLLNWLTRVAEIEQEIEQEEKK